MSGAAKRLVVFLFSFFSAVSEGTRTKLLTTHRYIRGLALFIFLRPAYEQLDRMEDHILWASEDVVEKCRQTYMTECNMSAIAGTIIAQVALTSLVLPNLSQTHWIARAAFLLSLVSGCLAVFYASLLQRTLGNFRRPEQVKEWWRRDSMRKDDVRWGSQRMDPLHIDPLSVELHAEPYIETYNGIRSILEDIQWDIREASPSLRRHGQTTRQLELQSSVAAAILMSSPSMMINFALGAFLTGIGVYLGFVWKNDLDTIASKSESLNVFICFLISLAFCYSFYGFPLLSKLWEDNKKSPGKKREIQENLLKVYTIVGNILAHVEDYKLEEDSSRRKKLSPFLKTILIGVHFLEYRSCLEAVNAAEMVRNLPEKWDAEDKEWREKEERRAREMERDYREMDWRERELMQRERERNEEKGWREREREKGGEGKGVEEEGRER